MVFLKWTTRLKQFLSSSFVQNNSITDKGYHARPDRMIVLFGSFTFVVVLASKVTSEHAFYLLNKIILIVENVLTRF